MESRSTEGLYEAQLRVLEQQLRDALLDGDHGAVAALLSPGLFMMDGQGGRVLELPWLQDWRQGHLQIHALQAHAVETLLCGRLALLSSDVQLHVHWRGREHVQRLRLLRVWTSASGASGAQLLSMAVMAG
ncbi:nuclear transport factor 2 family protein [Stenotrophomonas indicatrix]|uniref:nuclear transport factor 2 family protein n=1 Tax=Stenotrophomonas indicatrix TaxID=2045451 RepID=UPI001AA190C4|nr:nuclear transport factor 2 family protein [Stenotrophomonas indicatrix]MBO1746710.1 nuclear transport factor 2 family protein [Stenotrophomonas indicatrix]